RREADEAGFSVFLIGGRCQSQQPVAMAPGTTIESRNLFFSTPARKKFLKSDPAEAGAISHMMNAFSLAHPELSFQFFQDQRQILDCPKTASLKERIFQIFGADLLEHLLEIDESLYHFRITGYVSSAAALKTSKNYQYFFINHRFV